MDGPFRRQPRQPGLPEKRSQLSRLPHLGPRNRVYWNANDSAAPIGGTLRRANNIAEQVRQVVITAGQVPFANAEMVPVNAQDQEPLESREHQAFGRLGLAPEFASRQTRIQPADCLTLIAMTLQMPCGVSV